MANTRSMSKKLKKFTTSNNDSSKSWSNLPYDLLLLVMMQIGIFDFIALSGVCKSWRSAAVSNWNKFMKSKQPMRLSISSHLNKKEYYLEDYTRRKLKITIPHFNYWKCVGITCGYLIFFRFSDFLLVNPFTQKQLRFPGYPFAGTNNSTGFRGILVFSPSMSGWVFVVTNKRSGTICFSLAGKQAGWTYIFSSFDINDLHFFKGKIYMVDDLLNHLWEFKLGPKPTLTPLQIYNFPWSRFRNLEFVSSSESLYVVDKSKGGFEAIEVDLDEMKCVDAERTMGEYAVFVSKLKCDAAIKPDAWIHPWTRYERLNYSHGGVQSKKKGRCSTINMWYFPLDCLSDNNSENGALMNILEE